MHSLNENHHHHHQPLCFELNLPLATIIQSTSLSYILFSISSSSSSLIPGVVALTVRLFFAFHFNPSASASSTISSISFVSNTNFPEIATRFPFLRSPRARKRALAPVFSFHNSTFSEYVFSTRRHAMGLCGLVRPKESYPKWGDTLKSQGLGFSTAISPGPEICTHFITFEISPITGSLPNYLKAIVIGCKLVT